MKIDCTLYLKILNYILFKCWKAYKSIAPKQYILGRYFNALVTYSQGLAYGLQCFFRHWTQRGLSHIIVFPQTGPPSKHHSFFRSKDLLSDHHFHQWQNPYHNLPYLFFFLLRYLYAALGSELKNSMFSLYKLQPK